MTDTYFHWPSRTLPIPDTFSGENEIEREQISCELEQRFTKLFGYPSIVVPSGRSAISLSFLLAGANRLNTIFAPKFSSHCVWNVVGRYGNPTINLTDDVDVILAVHLYGHMQRSMNSP